MLRSQKADICSDLADQQMVLPGVMHRWIPNTLPSTASQGLPFSHSLLSDGTPLNISQGGMSSASNMESETASTPSRTIMELAFTVVDLVHPLWKVCGHKVGAFQAVFRLVGGREVHWTLRITRLVGGDRTSYRVQLIGADSTAKCSHLSITVRNTRSVYPDPGNLSADGRRKFFQVCEREGSQEPRDALPWDSYRDLLMLAFKACPYLEAGRTRYPLRPVEATGLNISYV